MWPVAKFQEMESSKYRQLSGSRRNSISWKGKVDDLKNLRWKYQCSKYELQVCPKLINCTQSEHG
jgi:hypothetical protein